MFAPLVAALRELAPALGRVLGVRAARRDRARARRAARAQRVRYGRRARGPARRRAARQARARARSAHDRRGAGARGPIRTTRSPRSRRRSIARALAERLRALRAGRQPAGEPAAAVEAAVAALGDTELAALAPALATCQLWYCEAATSGLSPAGAARRARRGGRRRAHRSASTRRGRGTRSCGRSSRGSPATSPACAIGCASSRPRSPSARSASCSPATRDARSARYAVGAARLATDPDAIVIDFVDTEESAALVTLLGLYETRSQVAFHHDAEVAVRPLRPAQGRVRSRRERGELPRVDERRAQRQGAHARLRASPARIVEIGPGGGVVLDLLEARFPERRDHRRRSVARGRRGARGARAAPATIAGASCSARPKQLPELVQPAGRHASCSARSSTRSTRTPTRARSRSRASRDVIRAAWAALRARRPHRDPRRRDAAAAARAASAFVAPDARPTFDLYVAQFEGRTIEYRELAPDRVELSAADAMEFLYTYTWGPASFPYEVRELYGILPYDDYVARARRVVRASAHASSRFRRRCAATCSPAIATSSPARSS